MKKQNRAVSLLLTAALLAGMLTCIPSAAAVDRELVPTGLCMDDAGDAVTTVIDFGDGGTYTAAGAIDITATERSAVVERIESYEVRYDGEVILTVEPRDIAATGSPQEMPNGYYAISFDIPDTTRSCFLTGLTPEKTDQIQSMLLESYLDDENFEITDADFIDANKTRVSDGLMCWAGSVSDMLQYTGWGAQAGFGSEDDLFDLFDREFEDEGYFHQNGIEWFFHGTAGSVSFGTDIVKNYPDSGGYLRDYVADELAYRGSFLSDDDYSVTFRNMLSDLRNGCAVGLSIFTGSESAHAITLWGYITDDDYAEDDMAHYPFLFVGDSDDASPTDPTDRRTAPKKLRATRCRLFEDPYGEYMDSLPQPFYAIENECPLYEYTSLKPYSPDVPKETDPRATKDIIRDPDFKITDANVSSGSHYMTDNTVSAADVCLSVGIHNLSSADFEGELSFRVDLYDGETAVDSVTAFADSTVYAYGYDSCRIELGDIKAGDYRAVITANPDGGVTEAYYGNNTFTFTFTAREPEYDVSAMTLSASFSDGPVAENAEAVIDYSGIDPMLLEDAEVCYVTLCADMNGMKPSVRYEVLDYYGDGLSLPGKIRFRNNSYPVSLVLTVQKNGLYYDIASPDYRLVFWNMEPVEIDNSVVTPLPRDGMQFAEGERIAFRLKDISFGVGDYAGECSIAYYDPAQNDYVPVTESLPFNVSDGGVSGELAFTSLTVPLSVSTFLYAVVDAQFDGAAGRHVFALSFIKVIEPGSSVVDLEDDWNDPTDGKTSLREALTYCAAHPGEGITFDGVERLMVEAPLDIDSVINMTNPDVTRPVTICTEKNCTLFRVSESGELNMRGLILSGPDRDREETADSMLLCEGGRITLTDCRITDGYTSARGGAIEAVGGAVIMKNSMIDSFFNAEGAIVYLDGGARIELLNSAVLYATAERSTFYNADGDLVIISSLIYSSSCLEYEDHLAAISSASRTTVVNSLLIDNDYTFDVSGSVSLYSVAYNRIDGGITADSLSRAYESADLFTLNYFGFPDVKLGQNGIYPAYELSKAALDGCYVSVHGGRLCISKDNARFTDIGVMTAFKAEELSRDMYGSARRSVFGPYDKLVGDYIVGDANLDGSVDLTDATLIQRYDARMLTLGELALLAADVNGDGEVSVVDATWLQRWDLGMKAPAAIGTRITG